MNLNLVSNLPKTGLNLKTFNSIWAASQIEATDEIH